MSLTAAQIATFAARAGWRGVDLQTAIAVALAESSGNPNARNTHGGADARGLWQINVAGDAHPELASQNLYDPQTNANAAFSIWQRNGWGPWSAHNSGAYLLYLPIASAAAQLNAAGRAVTDPGSLAGDVADTANVATNNTVSTAGGMLDATRRGVEAVVKAGAWLADRNNWVRIAQVGIGGWLVVGGLLIVTRQTWEPIVKDAGKAVGAAAVAA